MNHSGEVKKIITILLGVTTGPCSAHCPCGCLPAYTLQMLDLVPKYSLSMAPSTAGLGSPHGQIFLHLTTSALIHTMLSRNFWVQHTDKACVIAWTSHRCAAEGPPQETGCTQSLNSYDTEIISARRWGVKAARSSCSRLMQTAGCKICYPQVPSSHDIPGSVMCEENDRHKWHLQ